MEVIRDVSRLQEAVLSSGLTHDGHRQHGRPQRWRGKEKWEEGRDTGKSSTNDLWYYSVGGVDKRMRRLGWMTRGSQEVHWIRRVRARISQTSLA